MVGISTFSCNYYLKIFSKLNSFSILKFFKVKVRFYSGMYPNTPIIVLAHSGHLVNVSLWTEQMKNGLKIIMWLSPGMGPMGKAKFTTMDSCNFPKVREVVWPLQI